MFMLWHILINFQFISHIKHTPAWGMADVDDEDDHDDDDVLRGFSMNIIIDEALLCVCGCVCA